MTPKFRVTLFFALASSAFVSACAPLDEVQTTGNLVTDYSLRLNTELQSFEKSLNSNRQTRAGRIGEMERKAQAYEDYVTAVSRVWIVSDDQVAMKLFESVRETRPSIAETSMITSGAAPGPGGAPLYDPKPVETMIKRIQDLIKDESPEDRVAFAFEFARDVWAQVEEKQQNAQDQVDSADENVTTTVSGNVDSSVNE